MKNKLKWLLVFFVIFGCLGYFREFFFVHLNNIMYMKYYQRGSTLAVPRVMHVFTGFSYQWLYYCKYPFTILWTLIFFLANYFTLQKLAPAPLLRKVLVYAYILMFILAATSMAYGYFLNHRLANDEYTLSRWLLGVAQSPIICLILLASEKLYNKQTVS